MAEDPPRRNTLRMGALLPREQAEPDAPRRAPHPATIARAAPQRYVLLGEAPSRRRARTQEVEPSDDPVELYEHLAPHLSWLPEERRPELRRLLMRGELARVLRHFEDEHARYPKNVSVEKCQKIVERALTQRLVKRLEPTDRVPVLTGEVPSSKPRDPRVLVADRIDGVASVDDILRGLPVSRLAALSAFDELLSEGVIAFKAPAERPAAQPAAQPAEPIAPRVAESAMEDEPPVSGRPTRADPIESETIAARIRPARRESPVPPAPAPEPPKPPEPLSPFASFPPRPSETPPDPSRRLVTALVGTTGAAIGIAVVAIVFAARDPEPPALAGAKTERPLVQPAQPSATAAPAPSPAPAAPEPSLMKLTIEVSPDYARVFLDQERIKPPFEHTLPRNGKDHELKIEAPGHKPRKIPFKANADLALVVALEALPKKKKPSTSEDIY